jgi:hypothetical protein
MPPVSGLPPVPVPAIPPPVPARPEAPPGPVPPFPAEPPVPPVPPGWQPSMHRAQMSDGTIKSVAQQAQAQTLLVHWPSTGMGTFSSDEQVHFEDVNPASHWAMAVYWPLHDTVPGDLAAAATQSAWQLAEAQEDGSCAAQIAAQDWSSVRPLMPPADDPPVDGAPPRAEFPPPSPVVPPVAPYVPPAPEPRLDSPVQAVSATKRQRLARSQVPLPTETFGIAILHDKGRRAEIRRRDCASRRQPGR